MLLDELRSRQERHWYAAAATEYGWSRDVLTHQVVSWLAEQVGSATSSFSAALPAPDSVLAQQLVRDPYVFDHLALSGRAVEREHEQALMDRLEQTLLACGIAFIGRQVRFDVAGDELGAGPAAVLTRAVLRVWPFGVSQPDAAQPRRPPRAGSRRRRPAPRGAGARRRR